MKTCIDCNKTKPLPEFTVKRQSHEPFCKLCRGIRYHKSSLERVVKRIYGTQQINSIKRNHPQPTYSYTELCEWVRSNPYWQSIYQNWIANEYSKDLAPSIDRLDNTKGYSLTNIRLVTWKVNRQQRADDCITGIEISNLRPVRAFTKDGILFKEFHSIGEAIRQVKGNYYGICSVANGVMVKDGKGKLYMPRSYKGYIWQWV